MRERHKSEVMTVTDVFVGASYIKATKHPSSFSLYDPAPLFRRVLTLTDTPKAARLFVQCPSFAEIYINGVSVTEDRFFSATSDYSKLLWYHTFDVTHLLRRGENAVCLMLGNGFFNESFETPWDYHKASWRDAPQALLALYVDGVRVLVSDGSWRSHADLSHVIYTHLRSGEHHDMRRYDESWLLPSYDDRSWCGVITRDVPSDARILEIACPPIRETERIAPVSVRRVARGYLVDFGVTISGYVDVTLHTERGQEIRFFYAEQIEGDEPVYYYNGARDARSLYPQCPYHMDRLIASGGEDVFHPHFTYHGFRFVLIEGLHDAPPSSIHAVFVHQDVRRTSTFVTGSEVLSYIYEAGIRSTYSNMFWCLTDCPTREKLGWANDAQATLEQTLINFDIIPLYETWFEDIKAAMREDGALPGIVPSSGWGFRYGPVCDGLLFELPYRIYLYTADAHLLMDGIPYFERYARFLMNTRASGHEFSLGDWMGTCNNERIPCAFVQDFYLIKALRITVMAHHLQGTPCAEWELLHDTACRRFMEDYLTEDGSCRIDEQTSVSMMLMFGLYRDREVLCRQLVDACVRDGYRITCGMVGTQYLYDALSLAGRADIAYRMITESEPGYKSWFKQGATTLWECFFSDGLGSRNHHMFSGVIAWFYKGLLGIAPSDAHPGFEAVTLTPGFVKDARFVSARMRTVKGELSCAWEYDGQGFLYTVTVPPGMRVDFRGTPLVAGENRFYIMDEEI